MTYFKFLLEPGPNNTIHFVLKGDPATMAAAIQEICNKRPDVAAMVLTAALAWMSENGMPISDAQSIAAANGFFTGK